MKAMLNSQDDALKRLPASPLGGRSHCGPMQTIVGSNPAPSRRFARQARRMTLMALTIMVGLASAGCIRIARKGVEEIQEFREENSD